jgi:histidinol-phosphate aminotransferase
MARRRETNLKEVYEQLKGKRILVRYFDNPGLQDCLRISVGTPQEIRSLLKAMADNPTP